MEKEIAYKGFEKDWTCKGFQYEIGKTFKIDGEIEPCQKGFHACPMPLDIFNYYSPFDSDGNLRKFAEVEQFGKIEKDGDRNCSNRIKIKTALTIADLFKIHFELVKDTAIKSSHANTSGYRSHANTSGYRSHANTSGYRSHANTSGYRSHANTSGYRSHANTSGNESIACSLGFKSKASAKKGWIVIVDWRENKDYSKYINKIYSAKVGQKIKGIKIEPDTYYWFEDGEFKYKKIGE